MWPSMQKNAIGSIEGYSYYDTPSGPQYVRNGPPEAVSEDRRRSENIKYQPYQTTRRPDRVLPNSPKSRLIASPGVTPRPIKTDTTPYLPSNGFVQPTGSPVEFVFDQAQSVPTPNTPISIISIGSKQQLQEHANHTHFSNTFYTNGSAVAPIDLQPSSAWVKSGGLPIAGYIPDNMATHLVPGQVSLPNDPPTDRSFDSQFLFPAGGGLSPTPQEANALASKVISGLPSRYSPLKACSTSEVDAMAYNTALRNLPLVHTNDGYQPGSTATQTSSPAIMPHAAYDPDFRRSSITMPSAPRPIAQYDVLPPLEGLIDETLFEYGPFYDNDSDSRVTTTSSFDLTRPDLGPTQQQLLLQRAERLSSDEIERPAPQVNLVGGYFAPEEEQPVIVAPPPEVDSRGNIRIARLPPKKCVVQYDLPAISDMTVTQLKSELRRHSLPAGGKKTALQHRLSTHLHQVL